MATVRNSAWSRAEVEAAVADYLDMLELELRGEAYNKAEHNRQLRMRLNGRSQQSVEFKHANTSAVLIELGFPFIGGYKRRVNFQELLARVVEAQLAARPVLRALAERDAAVVPAVPTVDDILAALVEAPPVGDRDVTARRHTPRYAPTPVRQYDYLEREAHNRALGLAGEEFVVNYERARLLSEGRERLAADVEHVAVTQGDGTGYDILSFDATGRERLIEVKTTKYGVSTPFFVSRNELLVSKEREEQFHLYRVFDFRASPRLYTRSGAVDAYFRIEPVAFRAWPG